MTPHTYPLLDLRKRLKVNDRVRFCGEHACKNADKCCEAVVTMVGEESIDFNGHPHLWTSPFTVQVLSWTGQMRCERCLSKMIKRHRPDAAVCTSPLQFFWLWWCGCGHTEEGGVEEFMGNDEVAMKRWEEENRV